VRVIDSRNVACCVQGLEQSEAVMRLGLKLAFNPKRCSLHFQLNVANPEHAEVAKKLVDMAQKVSTPALLTEVCSASALLHKQVVLCLTCVLI